ncbi:MAG: hypothetical protein D6781_14765 [Verrucomicrobia bacterium]|nr:MAG: hypothetical protein D6781_14765 [Verrucomicrobiota bacterium]
MDPVWINGHPAHPTRVLAKLKPSADGKVPTRAAGSNEPRAASLGSSLVPGLVVLDLAPQAAASLRRGPAGQASASPEAWLLERMRALEATGRYEYVEPDYLLFPARVPGDEAFGDGRLWGLRNTGQDGGTTGMDISAEEAWDVTTGSSDVVVAVIDSGIRYTHRDLAGNMWVNPGEIPGNGLDDDGNGYVDDVHGIDAIEDTGNPMDTDGHGTHVAGIIGAQADGGGPAVGVAWDVRLMALKFLDDTGVGSTADAIECIDYAVAHGARIINASWGGEGYSRALREAIERAGEAGAIMVIAAGNEGFSIDDAGLYPAAFDLMNAVVVSAIDRRGERSVFSNFGVLSVHLAAPGEAIFSTYKDSDEAYSYADGTSAAAPHVSGIAALLLARAPELSVLDLRGRLLAGTVPLPSLQGIVSTGGRADALAALTAVPDGALDIEVFPSSRTRLVGGRTQAFVVRVSDLDGVEGAGVSGGFEGGEVAAFQDLGDGLYRATLDVPEVTDQLFLRVTASLAGKTDAVYRVAYRVGSSATNDDFADRITIEPAGGTYTATNFGAGYEPGEPQHLGMAGGGSVWWSWTAPGDGVFVVRTDGFLDTRLAIYRGESIASLSLIAENDDRNEYLKNSLVEIEVRQGEAYQIAVDTPEGVQGDFTLVVEPQIAPANDDFSNATLLEGDRVAVRGDTRFSTLEPGEPEHPGIGSEGGSVWWSWMPARDGAARVSVSSGRTVAVFAGETLENLVELPGREGDSESSRRVPVVSGELYRIVVTDPVPRGGSESSFTLSVEWMPAPENDRFAASVTVSGDVLSVSGSLDNATREPGEVSTARPSPESSVWWSWIPGSTGNAVLTAQRVGVDVPPRLFVFSGSRLDDLVPVASGLGGGGYFRTTRLFFPVLAGTAYHIAVDGDVDMLEDVVVLEGQVGTAAANDMFAGAEEMNGERFAVTGSLDFATSEAGEPESGGIGRTLWWKWTAPKDAVVRLESTALVNVYVGEALASLTRVADELGATSKSRYMFIAEKGVTYWIQIDARFADSRQVSIRGTVGDPVPNDSFDGRLEVSGEAFALDVPLSRATQDPEDLGGGASLASVWWSWRAPKSGFVWMAPDAGVSQTVRIEMFTGASRAGLTAVVDAYSGAADGALFAVEAGEVYQIKISGSAVSGDAGVSARYVEPPANDLFAERRVLEGESFAVSEVMEATGREPNEPTHGFFPQGNSVWYSWTAPADGVLLFRALAVDGEGYCLVYPYSGSGIAQLTAVELLGGPPAGAKGFSAGSVRVEAGETFHFAVEQRGASGLRFGTIRFEGTFARRPANDDFASATALAGEHLTVAGTTLGSSAEPGEPEWVPLEPNLTSRWWVWMAPRDGIAVVSLGEVDTPRVAVFEGESLPELSSVVEGDRIGFTNKVVFAATAGRRYVILVGDSNGVGGAFNLSITMKEPVSNDRFANPADVTGERFAVEGDTTYATLEPDESNIGGLRYHGSLWWRWTAPRDGILILSATGGAAVALYEGDALDALTSRLRRKPGNLSGGTAHVYSGHTYLIQVMGHDEQPFRLEGAVVSKPGNDSFANRTILAGESVRVAGTLEGATPEAADPKINRFAPFATVWWSWEAPRDGRALIRLPRELTDRAALRVFTGADLAHLTELGAGETVPFVRLDVEAGQVYHIGVDSQSGWLGPFDLLIDVDDLPSKESKDGAADLGILPARVEGDSLMAKDGVLWWRFVAPRNERIHLRVNASFRHPSLSIVEQTGTKWSGGLGSYRAELDGGRLEATFDALAGATYLIAAGDAERLGGRFSLDAEVVAVPANDTRENAALLLGAPVRINASNVGATWQIIPSDSSSLNSSTMLWWRWIAPRSGPAEVRFGSEDIPGVVGIGVLGPEEAVRWLGTEMAESGAPASVSFEATEGSEYLVFAGGQDGLTGPFSLAIDVAGAPNAAIHKPSGIFSAGSTVTLRADAAGVGPFAYQWYRDGVPIPGATTAELRLVAAQSFQSGAYSVEIRDAVGSSMSEPTMVTVVPAEVSGEAVQLLNLSTRAFGAAGEQALIPGFVIEGGRNRLLVRAVGPTLEAFGVEGVLSDPEVMLRYFDGEKYVDRGSNGDWGESLDADRISSVSEAVGAFPMAEDLGDAAMLADLAAGQYTVTVEDTQQRSGVAIVELYDARVPGMNGALVNISNRGFVGRGSRVMIPGFVIGGEGVTRILLRAVGPGLEQFEVSGFLSDPQLILYRKNESSGQDDLVLVADNWGEFGDATAVAETGNVVGAFPLRPNSRDAAVVVTLPPGAYTVHARGADDGEGVALVEVYRVP